MQLYYFKPELEDLSQGSRIAFVRQFRFMIQDSVSDKLGLTGDCKRRTMTRYEKGDRNSKDNRTLELAKIFNVSFDSIKKYDYKNPIDLFYTLMWLEEYIPNYQIDLSKVPNIREEQEIKVVEDVWYGVDVWPEERGTGRYRKVDRWSRVCKKCGKKEYTYEMEKVPVKTVSRPKFK